MARRHCFFFLSLHTQRREGRRVRAASACLSFDKRLHSRSRPTSTGVSSAVQGGRVWLLFFYSFHNDPPFPRSPFPPPFFFFCSVVVIVRKTDAVRTRCQRSSEKRTDTQFVSNIKGRRESQTNHAEIIGCNDEVQAHTCVERHKSESKLLLLCVCVCASFLLIVFVLIGWKLNGCLRRRFSFLLTTTGSFPFENF